MPVQRKNIVGNTLIPPQAIIRAYARELRSMVHQMIKAYRPLITIYKEKRDQMAFDAREGEWLTTAVEERLNKLGKEWADKFREFAQAKSKTMVLKVLRNSDLQVKQALKDYFSQKKWELIGESIPVPMQQVMKASIANNVSLITSIAIQYHQQVSGALYRAIAGQGTLEELQTEFFKYSNLSYRRTKNICNNEIHKAFTQLAAQRMNDVGITKVKWVHDSPETPRPFHIRQWDGHSHGNSLNGLNGYIFELSNPPLIDPKTGRHGLPADLYGCKCRLAPVLK